MSDETLDFLLAQKDHFVELLKTEEYPSEWVWWIGRPIKGEELNVHGGYTKEQAYEDALRDCLGLDPIADEKIEEKTI